MPAHDFNAIALQTGLLRLDMARGGNKMGELFSER